MTDVPGIEKIPRLAGDGGIQKQLFQYSKTKTDRGTDPSDPGDLVHQVQLRAEDVLPVEVDWLADPSRWTEDVTRRLTVVVEACESVGIPYQIEFDHDRQDPVVIRQVQIHLEGGK